MLREGQTSDGEGDPGEGYDHEGRQDPHGRVKLLGVNRELVGRGDGSLDVLVVHIAFFVVRYGESESEDVVYVALSDYTAVPKHYSVC